MKKVSNMKRYLWLVLMIAALPVFGQAIKVQNTSIHEGDAVSSISEFTIDFDFSDAASATGKSVEELGIGSALKNKTAFRALIYKGSKDSEYIGINQTITEDFIVGSGYYTIAKNAVVAGTHTITIPLSQTVTLEPGEHYTIYIPKGKLMAGVPGTLYSSTATTEPIIIEVVGAQTSGNELKLVSSEPSTGEEIDILSTVNLTFNQEIKLQNSENITLIYNGTELAKSVNSGCEGKQVTFTFDNVKLYKGKDYVLNIPANSIQSLDGTQTMNAISLFYKGGSYDYMSTGRIYPSTKNPISWLSTVKIPFVFPEGYNIGKVESANVRLYEGSLDNEPIALSLGESNDLNSISIDVWKFDLKPNTTYYVVLDKEQIFPARMDDYKIKLKDVTNDEVILAYTTPSELEKPAKVEVVAEPAGGTDIERLDFVTFRVADYEFENNTYLGQLAGDNPVAIFSDGTNETQLPLTLNVKEKKATCEVNRALEAGKTYTLKVPAGTFAPSANANLAAVAANDELVYTFVGKAADSYTLTYAVEGQAMLVTEVAPQAEVKVSFPENDGFKVASIAFNGEQQAVAETFTTPAIAKNSVLDIAYEYAGKIDYDFTTGVTAPEDCPFTVTSEGEMLVVEGVKAGDTIRIYTAGGLMMADLGAVPAGMSRASFRLATGQVYILLVNTTALKLRH